MENINITDNSELNNSNTENIEVKSPETKDTNENTEVKSSETNKDNLEVLDSLTKIMLNSIFNKQENPLPNKKQKLRKEKTKVTQNVSDSESSISDDDSESEDEDEDNDEDYEDTWETVKKLTEAHLNITKTILLIMEK